MACLHLHLLGSPRLEIDDAPVHITRRKSLAILVYLAETGQIKQRDTLAILFWPESPQDKARGELRRALSSLNRSLGDGWLDIDRESAALNGNATIWIDTCAFGAHLAGADDVTAVAEREQRLSEAISLYRSDFLAGFTLSGCPDFDDWQFFQTEGYRQLFATALEQMIALLAESGRWNEAVSPARRRLSLDPLHEPAHRTLMQIYAECGQRSAALRQYEECRRVLDEELGVAPDHETTELANSIRQRRFPPSDSGGQPSLNQERPSGGKPEVLDSSPRSDKEGTAVVQHEIRVVTVLAAGLCQTSETDWDLPPDQSATLIGQMVEVVGQIVADFGGDVAHLLVDGALAIFGATVIHEDDVERAARAALSIRNAAAGLALDVAIGIATGTAYVSPVAGGNEASAVGAVVNLATRLQARAAAGQILIAETTYHQTRGLLRTTPMAMQLRGRAEPITVYHVERARRSAAKARGIEGVQTELIGRDAELARLSALLQESHRGCGQMVALIGDAGIGKSRLIADLKRTANPTLWLEGRCLEMSSDTPYAPFIDLLRSYLDWPVGSSEAQRATGIVSALDRLVDEGNLSEEERETMGPLLGNLLAVRYNTDWDSRLSPAGPEQIRFQTLQAVHDLLLAIARSQPMTLVLEDLHWADDLTIDLITALMDDLAESPLMLLCVYRPQRQHRCWQLAAVASLKCLDRFTEIRLHELTTEQGNRMVLSLAGDRPFSADTQAMVLARAQGNPFFIEEIVHSLIGGAAPAEKAIPESVQAVILSRVDRLHPEAKLFLQAAATLGRTFVQRIVAAMAPEISDMEETLAELQEHAILYQERVLPEVAYSFRHVLVQEAVYATLPGQRRRDLHGQAGRAIEDAYSESLPEQVERLAYHFDRSDDDGKAVEYLLLAGERARTAYLNQVAISYFERILDRLDGATPKPKSDEQEFQALIGLGKLYATISKYEEADNCLRHALKLGREMALPASRLAPIYHWLGDLLINWDGHMQQALALCLEGLELVGDAKTVESAMIEGILGFVYEMTGEATKHAEIARRLETYVLELPYQAELSTAFGVVGIYYFNGKNMAEAMHWRQEALKRYWAAHDLRRVGDFPLGFWGLLLGADSEEVLGGLREARKLLVQVGDDKRVNRNDVETAIVAYMYGELDTALTHLRRATLDAPGINDEHLPDMQRWLGETHIARGEYELAVEVLREATSHYKEADLGFPDGLISLGSAALAVGNRVVAIDHFTEALESMGTPDIAESPRPYKIYSPSLFALALSRLEAAYENPARFEAFCHGFRQRHPDAQNSRFTHWSLERVTPQPTEKRPRFDESFQEALSDEWMWQDPAGGAQRQIDNGLAIYTPNVRDLWWNFLTAPRLLHSIEGDFAIQTVCLPLRDDRPAIGGVLIWLDKRNYLRLDRGTRGPGEVSLQGCIDNEDVVFGRGSLLGERVWLRLEHAGDTVRGLCSADGDVWYSVGKVDFPAVGQIQAGIFAASNIDRTVYHGAYRDGTAIQFESVTMWEAEDGSRI